MLSPNRNYNREFPSPLHGFYTISNFRYFTTDRGLDASRSLEVDLVLFDRLSALCESHHPGFPVLPPNGEPLSRDRLLETIDADIEVWIESLPTVAIRALLHRFQQYSRDPRIRRLWTNYYINTCHVIVLKIWRILPARIRTQEKLESILGASYALFSIDLSGQICAWSGFPNQMLRGFQIGDSPSLDRLCAWSYRTIRNKLYTKLREGEVPYVGLSDLGVVTNNMTSFTRIQTALISIDLLGVVKSTLLQKYSTLEQEALRAEIFQAISNHLAVSTEEQYIRCRLLAQTLKAYEVPTNQLVESSFIVVGNFYQDRLADFYRHKLTRLHPQQSNREIQTLLQQQLPVQMSPQAIKILLMSIGSTVRQYAFSFRDPVAIQYPISDDMTLEEVLESQESPLLLEDMEDEISSEQVSLLYQLIGAFCQLPPVRIDRLSHQQILWLRFGLDLRMIDISSFRNIHFGTAHPNPGGASLCVGQACTALVRYIHQEMNSSERLNEDAIELAIEVIKNYFSAIRRRLLTQITSQLGIESSVDLTERSQNEFIYLFTTEIEQMSRLSHHDDVSRSAIERIANDFLTTNT
jgi:hypothetical protein